MASNFALPDDQWQKINVAMELRLELPQINSQKIVNLQKCHLL